VGLWFIVKSAQLLQQCCLVFGLLVNLLDDTRWLSGYHDAGVDVLHDHRAGCDHAAFADPTTFQHNCVGADQHIVFDDDRFRTGRLEHTREHGTRTNMTVLADQRARTNHRVHVNHGAFADH
jgi:hypothetical protein